jgi:hypothetical protein
MLFDFENNFQNGENKELLQYRHRPFFSLMSLVLSGVNVSRLA